MILNRLPVPHDAYGVGPNSMGNGFRVYFDPPGSAILDPAPDVPQGTRYIHVWTPLGRGLEYCVSVHGNWRTAPRGIRSFDGPCVRPLLDALNSLVAREAER